MRNIKLNSKKYNFSKQQIIFFCLLLMTIGYASVTSRNTIKSMAILSVNLSDLDCYIGNIFIDSKNHFDYLSNDLSSFTFKMSGTSTTLNYYIRNNSTEYDESVKIACSTSDDSNLKITNNLDNLVKAQSVNSGEMVIEKEDSAEKNILCKLSYENISRESISLKNKAVFYSSVSASIDKPYSIYEDVGKYTDLPKTTRGISIFLGWFDKNKKLIDENTKIESMEDEILYSEFSILHAKYTKFDNTKSKSDCVTVQCAIDEINSKLM